MVGKIWDVDIFNPCVPKCGKNTGGRLVRNFINQLIDDTNLDKENLETAMNDREY